MDHKDIVHRIKRIPLWKWLVIILLIIAMPLFFSFYRSAQIQQALIQSTPGALEQPVENPVDKN